MAAGMVRRLKSIWNLSRVFWLHAGCFSHPLCDKQQPPEKLKPPKSTASSWSFCVGQDLKNNTDDTTACNLIPWLGKKKSSSGTGIISKQNPVETTKNISHFYKMSLLMKHPDMPLSTPTLSHCLVWFSWANEHMIPGKNSRCKKL